MQYLLSIDQVKVVAKLKTLSNGKPEIYAQIEKIDEIQFEFESELLYEEGDVIDLSEIDRRIGIINVEEIVKTCSKYIIHTLDSIVIKDENYANIESEYRQLLKEWSQRSLWVKIKYTRNKVMKLGILLFSASSILMTYYNMINQNIVNTVFSLFCTISAVKMGLLCSEIETIESSKVINNDE